MSYQIFRELVFYNLLKKTYFSPDQAYFLKLFLFYPDSIDLNLKL